MSDMDILASQIASILAQAQSEEGGDASADVPSAPQDVPAPAPTSSVEDELASLFRQGSSVGESAPAEATPVADEIDLSSEDFDFGAAIDSYTSEAAAPVPVPTPAPQEDVAPATSSSSMEEMISAFLREDAAAATSTEAPAPVVTPEPVAAPPAPAPVVRSTPVAAPPAPAPAPVVAPTPDPEPAPEPVSARSSSRVKVSVRNTPPVEESVPFDNEPDPYEEEEEETSARKKQSFSFCEKCGDITPCKCSRYNRYDFSGVIVTLITSWIAWLFLDYATLTEGKAFTCVETFVAFCLKQDFSLLIKDFRFIMPFVAMIMNLLVILFVAINKPKPIRWIDGIAKLAIIIITLVAAGSPGYVLEYWSMNGFMLGGTVWWIATTVMNFMCGHTYKRGRLINNTIRKYR